MRFSTIAAFATSLAVVSAQTPDLSTVPDCAVTCLVAAIPGSGCGVTDTPCQCTTGQAAITKSLESCIPSSCSAEDAARVAPALAGICSAAGVSVSIPSSSMMATGAASAASSAASSAAASASAAISSAVSSAASAASSAASRASSIASSLASRTGASATASTPAQNTGGAVANAAGLGAVALGLFVAAL